MSANKRFRVAFSFAGQKRDYVAKVAALLAARFGEAAVLYDRYHEAEFARRDLALYLPDLYHDESDLVVVVMSPEYQAKEWCGLEWDAIFDLLKSRKNEEIMLCRFELATMKGLYSTAGFVELDNKSAEEATVRILERLALNEGRPKKHYLDTAPAGNELKRQTSESPADNKQARLVSVSVEWKRKAEPDLSPRRWVVYVNNASDAPITVGKVVVASPEWQQPIDLGVVEPGTVSDYELDEADFDPSGDPPDVSMQFLDADGQAWTLRNGILKPARRK